MKFLDAYTQKNVNQQTQIKIMKKITAYSILLVSFFSISCTHIEKDVSLTTSISTKSLANDKFSLSEKEAIDKAEQFFLGIEHSKQHEGVSRSISAMNLSEKVPLIETVVRMIKNDKNDIEQIPVYIINYIDTRNLAAAGYIVLVGDKRLNGVLVYSDTGSWNTKDPAIQNFINFFWENVDDMIKNELETIDSTSRGPDSPYVRLYGHPCCSYCDEYSVFSYYDNAKRLNQPALWGQYEPYNKKLEPACDNFIYYSGYYPTGCWATAMGQIMAYHQKPTSGSYVNYDGQTVNTNYNWSTMLTSQFAGSLSSQGLDMVQNLLAEIGEKVNMLYYCSGSSTTIYNARAGFIAMNYTTSPVLNYSYSTVNSEIYLDRPVAIRGGNSYIFGNHAWVIDGVNSQKIIEEIYWECSWIGGNKILLDTFVTYVDYVYCNLGTMTPNTGNGYFRSDIFNNFSSILIQIQ
jgi:hypothetical protein